MSLDPPISLPAQPPSYDDFRYRWNEPTGLEEPSSSSMGAYGMVEPPRLTPPPPGDNLFATNESESLANFLDDFEVNQEFLFQPALPSGIPDWNLLQGVDYGYGTLAPEQIMAPPPLPMAVDGAEGMDSDPPSPKRVKMEALPPAAFLSLSGTPTPSGSGAESAAAYSDTDSYRRRQRTMTTATSPTASSSSQTSVDQRGSSASLRAKSLLTNDQKRSNHIQSEQKRRNAIKDGFAELVNILQTGEPYSGLSIGYADDEGSGKKTRGRGRGRKGDHGAGTSKSVVIDQAVKYVKWMQTGNAALEAEVARLEQMAGIT